MSKAKRLKWTREHNRKCRQRQASRDGDFIVRSQGHFLTYQRINGAKPPPMRNGSPFIMIDDERIIVENY